MCVCVCVESLQSCVIRLQLWTIARQAPLPMGFSRQEYWGGLPCPPPGDLPNPGVEPTLPESSAFQVDSLPTESVTWETLILYRHFQLGRWSHCESMSFTTSVN